MIDWHSHILPKMDDGSRSEEESVRMLTMLASQGIDTVIATPHFYPDNESVQAFLQRREAAFERLKPYLTNNSPDILLGAEVRYYQGIGRMTEINKLRIEGSKLLLLEMPFSEWGEYVIRDLTELAGKGDIKIILAHIERYFSMQKRSMIERIAESGIFMQVNATLFGSFASRHKALKLLKSGYVQFIGSDCHNLTSRPPKIGKAFDIIQKKLSDDYLAEMNECGYSMLYHQ